MSRKSGSRFSDKDMRKARESGAPRAPVAGATMFGRFMRQHRLRDRASVVAAIGLCVVAAAMSLSNHARAAGGAYVVDTSEVSAAGSCKVETWISWASNRDSIGVANPACVVDVGRPVEFSGGFYRSRFDEEWATGMAPKAKTKIIPSAIGSFGLAISGQASYDFTTRETTALFVNLPATMRLSDVVRINVNAGWLWDRIVDRHYLFYGLGVDWRTPDNVWTFTAEVFGQAGPEQEVATVTQPRFQSGLRWRPVDVLSIDFIYGRNVYGENANWFTVATTIRFPPPGGKVGGE
jgi:hypothetical protein